MMKRTVCKDIWDKSGGKLQVSIYINLKTFSLLQFVSTLSTLRRVAPNHTCHLSRNQSKLQIFLYQTARSSSISARSMLYLSLYCPCMTFPQCLTSQRLARKRRKKGRETEKKRKAIPNLSSVYGPTILSPLLSSFYTHVSSALR